jgi:hypothetical protein
MNTRKQIGLACAAIYNVDETAIQLDSARNYGQMSGHEKVKILRQLTR